MPSEAQSRARARVAQMFRDIKVGDRVRATPSAGRAAGSIGVVVDVEPVSHDGVRRVVVDWDQSERVHVLPTSIEIV